MKNSLILLCLLFVMGACNDSATTNEETPNPTNVQNVNGNLPDTSAGINLNTSLHVDSSHVKDSLRK